VVLVVPHLLLQECLLLVTQAHHLALPPHLVKHPEQGVVVVVNLPIPCLRMSWIDEGAIALVTTDLLVITAHTGGTDNRQGSASPVPYKHHPLQTWFLRSLLFIKWVTITINGSPGNPSCLETSPQFYVMLP